MHCISWLYTRSSVTGVYNCVNESNFKTFLKKRRSIVSRNVYVQVEIHKLHVS